MWNRRTCSRRKSVHPFIIFSLPRIPPILELHSSRFCHWIESWLKQSMVCHIFIQIYFLSTLSLSTNPAIRCPWERKSWQCICRGGGEKWRGDEWVGGSAPESVPDPSLKRREWLKKGNVSATNVQDWLEKGEMIMGGRKGLEEQAKDSWTEWSQWSCNLNIWPYYTASSKLTIPVKS